MLARTYIRFARSTVDNIEKRVEEISTRFNYLRSEAETILCVDTLFNPFSRLVTMAGVLGLRLITLLMTESVKNPATVIPMRLLHITFDMLTFCILSG